jgi:hypothetical protein
VVATVSGMVIGTALIARSTTKLRVCALSYLERQRCEKQRRIVTSRLGRDSEDEARERIRGSARVEETDVWAEAVEGQVRPCGDRADR